MGEEESPCVGVRFWTGIVGEEESMVLGLGFGRE